MSNNGLLGCLLVVLGFYLAYFCGPGRLAFGGHRYTRSSVVEQGSVSNSEVRQYQQHLQRIDFMGWLSRILHTFNKRKPLSPGLLKT